LFYSESVLRFEEVLPLIDWDKVQDQASLSYVFGRMRGVIFSDVKMKLWRAVIAADEKDNRPQPFG